VRVYKLYLLTYLLTYLLIFYHVCFISTECIVISFYCACSFCIALLLFNYRMYCRGAIRAQSLAAPVILSAINVHVILLFQTNKPDDDDNNNNAGMAMSGTFVYSCSACFYHIFACS